MGFSWFRAESDAVDHPKMMALATALGVELSHADGFVFRLWCWAQRYAPTGAISASAVPHIDAYLGRAGVFGQMTKCRLVDVVGDGFCVHDWPEMQGALVEKSLRDAKLKRQKRRQNGAKTARAARTPGAETAPLQDRTGQDTTRQDLFSTSPAKKPRAPKPAAPADPRYQPMVGRLIASYSQVIGAPYSFQGSCGTALKALLKVATDDEIDRRWRVGLTADQYSTKCATVLQLHMRWNELAVSRTKSSVRETYEYTDSEPTT